MLIYDPVERAAATDLLSHAYILSVPEAATTSGGSGGAMAAGSSGSSTLGATAGLVNAAAKAMAPPGPTAAGAAAVAVPAGAAPLVAGDTAYAQQGQGQGDDGPATTKVR